MSQQVNQVTIIGNLGRDPEVRFTQNNKKVANMAVGVSCGSGDHKRTEWFRVVAFGQLADIIEKFAKKGTQVFCQGEQHTRKWQDSDGKDRFTTELSLGGFNAMFRVLSGGITDNTGSGYSTSSQGASDYGAGGSTQGGVDNPQGDPDEEIPF